MLKLRFVNLPEEFRPAIGRLSSILDYEISDDGTEIEVKQANTLSVSAKGGRAQICYVKKNHFFRALGILCEHMKKEKEFCVAEEPRFDTVGVMMNSTGTAMNVKNIKRYLDYLAVMGYNLVMLYTEYNFEIETEPCFGYMDGKYTHDELKECDDYAYDYGIEMMPCIQTLGHLEGFLKWQQAGCVKDTSSVLLAGSERTYERLDDIIKSAAAPYRSKRIHIGMDEAWDLGRGAYLDKNGYVPSSEIFMDHLKRVVDITNKYGLTPMMWSDMIFRVSSGGNLYYEKDTVISEDLKAKLPKEVELVYWHYGEEPGCDEYMVEKHLELDRNIIYAGGLWSWNGHLPENNYAFDSTKKAVCACKKYGVREMMTTVWSTEPQYSVLLGLSFSAEMAYTDNTDDEYLRSRFEICTKGNYDAFWAMSAYHNDFDNGKVYEDYHDRFAGVFLFYQDILQGKADTVAYELKLSSHYEKYANLMSTYHGEWEELYRWSENLLRYLHIKCLVSENIKPAYDRGDKDMLKKISNELLPKLERICLDIYNYQRNTWLCHFKGQNQRKLDSRYGALIFRIKACREKLEQYLDGKIDAIDELAEERLPYKLCGFGGYRRATE